MAPRETSDLWKKFSLFYNSTFTTKAPNLDAGEAPNPHQQNFPRTNSFSNTNKMKGFVPIRSEPSSSVVEEKSPEAVEEEAKQLKRAKNRGSAQRSREKKYEYSLWLEQEKERVKLKNATLKQQLKEAKAERSALSREQEQTPQEEEEQEQLVR